MAARKRSTPKPATPEQAPVSTPAQEPPAVPVRKVRIRSEEPQRAGGHVLTERGWVLES